MLLLALAGCNRYDLFLISGGLQAGGPNDADVLFVIDNSDSMFEESVALAENFGRFVEALTGREDEYGTDGLPDAVDRYVDYVQDPAFFVDFQLAITTVDVSADAGALRGDRPILRKGEPDVTEKFIETLMCDTTCFADRALVDADPTHACGDPFEGKVSRQYLDCLCGVDAWVGNCGGGSEEGIEAVFNAVCRATDEPLPECIETTQARLDVRDLGTSAGLLRPGATLIPVIVTDEGDVSHRVPNLDAFPATYLELFHELDVPMAWAVIGPELDENYEPVCAGLATSWGVLRYDFLTEQSGGLKLSIHGEDCGPTDWADALQRLGELVGGGISAYRLPKEPVVTSIAVEVGNKAWGPADDVGQDLFGLPLYSDGWSYREEDRTVLLHGLAVPEPGQEVTIWFWPKKH